MKVNRSVRTSGFTKQRGPNTGSASCHRKATEISTGHTVSVRWYKTERFFSLFKHVWLSYHLVRRLFFTLHAPNPWCRNDILFWGGVVCLFVCFYCELQSHSLAMFHVLKPVPSIFEAIPYSMLHTFSASTLATNKASTQLLNRKIA